VEAPRSAVWRDRIVTAEWVYGTVLVMALIAAGAPEDDQAATSADAVELLIEVLATVIVFWIAHAYAETIARHGRAGSERTRIGATVAAAARHSVGLLGAAVPLCIPILLAATGVIGVDDATDWAELIGLIVLAVSSAWTFIVRGSRWWVTVLGTVAAVLLGVIVTLLDLLLH
jgi:hypothetical protein